jgi:Holliday junction resolvase RusA-like endonuclease
VWPALPIEFAVVGTPVSHQNATAQTRDAWKDRDLRAALAVVPADSWSLVDLRLSVSILYFPVETMTGDLDNRIKLILDALVPTIMTDDRLIDRIVAQRVDPDSEVSFFEPSETMVAAMANEEPTVYIRIGELSLEDIRI